MENKYAPFEADGIYHVYNRANGSEKLFLSDENYAFFLRQYAKHIHPIAETFCYCLVPNHFHFLIRIKDEQSLIANLQHLTGFGNLSGVEAHIYFKAIQQLF